MVGIRGRLRVGAAMLGWLVSLSAVAGEWVMEDTSGTPGATVQVPVFFRADGQTAAAVATVFLEEPLRVQPPGHLPSDGDGTCVANVYGDVRVSIDTARRTAGTLIHVCSFPVTVPHYFRTQVPMTARADGCLDNGAQPVACSGGGARFLIDSEPRWYERAAVLIPRPAPRGPSQQALLDFDYANDPATPPLRSLDAPRPAAVDSIFAPGDWSFGKGAAVPNAAVAALLRAVRPTWRTRADLAAGVAAARADPQVETVIENAGSFPYLIHPARPVAGQPFALWMANNACRFFIPTSVDDRVIRVEGDVVHVFVPELVSLCGVPPGGEIHTVLNMPALPAGDYTLYVTGYGTSPDVEPDMERPLRFTVAPVALAPQPTRIPAAHAGVLLLLALAMFALARSFRAKM